MKNAIRAYRNEDGPVLAAVMLAAIRSIGPRFYSPAQITAWAASHRDQEHFGRRAAAGDAICVAVDCNDVPIAFTVLERDGHLDMLYCHPDHARQGLASRLLARTDDIARGWGLSRLFTEASEIARPVFERAGYVASHRRDFTLDGQAGPVAIHNYAMEKRLNSGARGAEFR